MSAIPASMDLSSIMSRMQIPQSKQGRIPTTADVAGLSSTSRKSADEIARYYEDQFQRSLSMRRGHATAWMKVLSIMNGYHHFTIVNGQWKAIQKRNANDIRPRTPMLKPRYRREHGRLSANQVGITASPITGQSADSFYDATLAQYSMQHWLEEVNFAALEDQANQELLVYGGMAYFAEKDRARGQVRPRSFPFCDLTPIPFDAKNWDDMDGVRRSTIVPDTWLQMQDEEYERQTGKKPTKPMAKFAQDKLGTPSADSAGFSSGFSWGTRFSGARVSWIWMKPNSSNGFMGEHLFMIEDQLYGYVSGFDENGRSIATPRGELPLYPVYYVKSPHDWWPTGFCEELVDMQREMNRQFKNNLESCQLNRGMILYDQNYVNGDAIKSSITGLVPFDTPGPESKGKVVEYLQPSPMNREMGMMMQIVDRFADVAAAHESPLIEGEASGRVDSGPSTQLLNANAQAPMTPILDRKWRALKQLFPDVLDGIREVWPQDKMIKVVGPHNMARELMVEKSRLPGSDRVVLSPTPLIVNGRMGMLNLIQTLRQQPTEDGSGPLITTAEFRRSLQMLNLAPPGMEIYDKREQRILYRIGQLIGDGKQPRIQPAGSKMNDPQQREDHALALKLVNEVILDPSFVLYGPAVQQALEAELAFHEHMLRGIHQGVDNFDDSAEQTDRLSAENMIEAMENDPTSIAGQFAPQGYPLGVG